MKLTSGKRRTPQRCRNAKLITKAIEKKLKKPKSILDYH